MNFKRSSIIDLHKKRMSKEIIIIRVNSCVVVYLKAFSRFKDVSIIK